MSDWGGYGGGGGYGYGAPAPPPYGGPDQGPKPEPFAIASVSVGGVGLFLTAGLGGCCGLFVCGGGFVGLVALGLGVFSLKRLSDEPEAYKGKWLAIGGIATGALSLVAAAALMLLLSASVFEPQMGGMGGRNPFDDVAGP